MTIVVQSHTIIPYAIDSGDIALVLRSARRNKCIPILYADIGPIGYYEKDIIVVSAAVTCPNREAQIVTN